MNLKCLDAKVTSNERVADNLYVIEMDCPPIAEASLPGQFVHMRIPGMDEHILRRPFSIYSWGDRKLDILYQVVGFGSEHLTHIKAGEHVDLIGPVGRSWQVKPNAQKVLLVGAGVGAAPLFMLYKNLIIKGIEVDVVYGASSKETLVCNDRFTSVSGKEPICSTDDGSYGFNGFCTLEARRVIEEANADGKPYDYIATCGPVPVMKYVSELASEYDIACEVSMERRMACGIGACLSCVVETKMGKRRACVDGPIFKAKDVIW